MAALILIIGLVLVVAAIRDTHGSLFAALGTDVPAFTVWAAAIFAIVAIGFVPGLKTVSRGLLALVLVVLVLNNYRQIIAGFSGASKSFAAGPTSPQGSDSATQQPLSVLTSLLSQSGTSEGFGSNSGAAA